MKKVLGLDLGTNSIGWALVEQDFENKQGQILGLGSRIIPMSQDVLSEFGKGVTKSQTAERTAARGTRRLYQRDNLRRERLHRVLNILGFLPEHYKNEIDFDFRKGQFINYGEPKLPYFKNELGKHEFLFKDSFNEMVDEFKKAQPDLFYLKANGKETKIPYDWTIYYLRKKALTQKITKEEFAWLILNFNQKRGYYQLSEDDQELDESKLKEFVILDVERLIETGEITKRTGDKLYEVYFKNGWKYDKPTARPQDWIGKTKEFIVTTSETKNGEIKRTYKAVNSEQDWIAIKKKTEQEIGKSGKTVGRYIYDTLLSNPTQKIRGKLVRTIERKFYKDEFETILKKQVELHDELQSIELYSACINELYPNNEAHRKNIEKRDFLYLFLDDIIFYQRPLKTKTHLISDCSFEYRIRKDTKEKVYIKCIDKSNPLFQEFRLWQFLANLKIYERERDGKFDIDVTGELLDSEDNWVSLFEWLNDKEKISQKQLLTYFKKKEDKFRWNYVEDKEYPCNETRAAFLNRLKKLNIDSAFLNPEITHHLWHLLYSVTDPEERKSAIKKFAVKHNLNEGFENLFAKFPLFKRDYGSFSEKAIKKLLPLMRKGKYWNENNINEDAKLRINNIIERLEEINYELDRLEEITDDDVPKQVLKSFIQSMYSLKGLNTYQASYLVYGRHSEASDTNKWATSQDIANFLNPKLKGSFKQHSLRNPIVEQVITETLRVVKDIWEQYAEKNSITYELVYDESTKKKVKSYPKFFDEIHIELGREMKNPADKRKKMTEKINENENTNLRIKAILNELLNDGLEVKPYSPSQQEILKIYEEGVYKNPKANFNDLSEDDVSKIRKNASPSKSEIQRYKLWLEQGYISPYTGKIIMLSDLFTHKYQIEHIIPQSRYFDDSLSNKIICEAEVNQLKDNRTAYEFIKEFGGTTVDLGQGRNVKVFTITEYEQHVKTYFNKNKAKRENLLSEDIPESFINRQMNDSRYISKVVKNLLSKIVREDEEKEVTSKHIVPVTGSITSKMKQDWGLNDIWNDIVTPRFQRMNMLTKSNDFGEINPNTNKFLPKVPDSLLKGFSKKRIDHRHHALDALVIACTTKDHINYITSINTKRENYSLVKKLRRIDEIELHKTQADGSLKIIKQNVTKEFHKPWETFTQDVKNKLETTIVSFKQNTRVITKTNNKYWSYFDEKGNLRLDKNNKPKKDLTKQIKGDNRAIRKALHQATIHGKISLRLKKQVSFTNGVKKWNSLVDKALKSEIKKMISEGKNEKDIIKHYKETPYVVNGNRIEKLDVYYFDSEKSATRKTLDSTFNEKNIESITDTGIQKILLKHLQTEKYQNQFDEKGQIIKPEELAFSSEGIEELNKNIQDLNNGKNHKPIKSVRTYEALGNKFKIGYNGSKNDKFVVAATGTNLYFAIYYNEEEDKRVFDTIPLNISIESLKQGLSPAPESRNGSRLLFTLSPNDLVYVPTQEEIENPHLVDFTNLSKEQTKRIYKMVKASGSECYFIRFDIASLIKQYDAKSKIGELSSQNKLETTMDVDAIRIKEVCWKLKVDRLGNISRVGEY